MGLLSSYLQAKRMEQEQQQWQIQNARAEEAHRSNMQQQQMQVQAMKREVDFLRGGDQAVKEGGVPQYLDYLDKTRPGEAVELRKAQSELNRSMLTGAREDQQLYKENQEMLGNVYSQFMGVSPDNRQKAYSEALPQIRKLDPEAPDQYDSGRAMMAYGQSLPTSQRYIADQTANKAQTQIGKAYQDKQLLINQGIDPDADVIKGLDAEIDKGATERAKALADATKAEMKAVKDRAGLSKIFADRYDKATKDYKALLDNYTKAQGLYKEAKGSKDNPPNAAAQATLATLMARAASPGIVTEEDFARAAKSDSFVNRVWNWKNRINRGDILTPREIDNIITTFDGMKKEQDKMYEPIIDQFTKLAEKSGLDKEDVVLDLTKGLTTAKDPEQTVKIQTEKEQLSQLLQKKVGKPVNLDAWLQEAKKQNPNASEAELLNALKKQVGGP